MSRCSRRRPDRPAAAEPVPAAEPDLAAAAIPVPAAEPDLAAPVAELDLAAIPVPVAALLGIPGYDSLSASQVVQRLAGLSNDELLAVGAYETAHRARRTVLTRVNQLLSA